MEQGTYKTAAARTRAETLLKQRGFDTFESFDSGDPDKPFGLRYDKSVEANAFTVNGARPFGWLTWWTIHQGEKAGTYDVPAVRKGAIDAAVPGWLVDRIVGKTPESAWMNATQLGAKGSPSANTKAENGHTTARYLVRDSGEDTRILIRETLDRQGVKVATTQIAVMYLKAQQLVAEFERDLDPAVQAEAEHLITKMRKSYQDMIGRIDDTKIRSLILDLLQTWHRVCVRGTGGTYWIPRPKDPDAAKDTVKVLWAVRKWVVSDPVGGSFSFAELSDNGATTVEEFTKSAMEELAGELEEIDNRLTRYAKNANMNDGSKMFSSDQMLSRIGEVAEKMEVLEEAVGEQMGTVHAMLDIIRAKAEKMLQESSKAVQAQKAEKSAGKAKANPAAGDKGTGKVGTAKDRAKAKITE